MLAGAIAVLAFVLKMGVALFAPSACPLSEGCTCTTVRATGLTGMLVVRSCSPACIAATSTLWKSTCRVPLLRHESGSGGRYLLSGVSALGKVWHAPRPSTIGNIKFHEMDRKNINSECKIDNGRSEHTSDGVRPAAGITWSFGLSIPISYSKSKNCHRVSSATPYRFSPADMRLVREKRGL